MGAGCGQDRGTPAVCLRGAVAAQVAGMMPSAGLTLILLVLPALDQVALGQGPGAVTCSLSSYQAPGAGAH